MNMPSLMVLILVVAALVALIWSLRLASAKSISREEAEQRMTGFNIEALAKLMDNSERDFLRSRLPARTFRKIQRQRMRVALAYLSDLSKIISAFDASTIGELRLLILRTRFQAMRMWLFPSSAVAPCELPNALHRLSTLLLRGDSEGLVPS
jgi:hypothetical protein